MNRVLFQNTWTKLASGLFGRFQDTHEVRYSKLPSKARRKVDWQAAVILDQLILCGAFSNEHQIQSWIRSRSRRFVIVNGKLAVLRPAVLVGGVIIAKISTRLWNCLAVWFWIIDQCNMIKNGCSRLKI
jgi:hypothetical protein